MTNQLQMKPDEFFVQMANPKPVVDEQGQQKVDKDGNPIIQLCDPYQMQMMQLELLLNIRNLQIQTAVKVGAIQPSTAGGLIAVKDFKA